MRAYSPDLRAKILAAVDAGMSKSQAARTFGVGLATIKRYAALRRETGTLDPKPHPGRPPLIGPEQQEVLWTQLVAYPTAYLDEQCDLWEAQTSVRLSISAMSRTINRLGFTRKKGRWVPPSAMKPSGRCGSASSGTSPRGGCASSTSQGPISA
jgi:transposase